MIKIVLHHQHVVVLAWFESISTFLGFLLIQFGDWHFHDSEFTVEQDVAIQIFVRRDVFAEVNA